MGHHKNHKITARLLRLQKRKNMINPNIHAHGRNYIPEISEAIKRTADMNKAEGNKRQV